MKQRKAKYTNKRLMEAIEASLKEKELYPDILDYLLPGSCCEPEIELRNYEFDNFSILNFGGSEGIYIDFAIKGVIDDSGENKIIKLGTAKTLSDDREAMQIMGKFLGDFTYELWEFVNKNIDDFTYLGFNVGNAERIIYEIREKDRAIQRASEVFEKYNSARIINNSTGAEYLWKEGMTIEEMGVLMNG